MRRVGVMVHVVVSSPRRAAAVTGSRREWVVRISDRCRRRVGGSPCTGFSDCRLPSFSFRARPHAQVRFTFENRSGTFPRPSERERSGGGGGGGGRHWFPPPRVTAEKSRGRPRPSSVHPFEREARTGNARRAPPSRHHRRRVPDPRTTKRHRCSPLPSHTRTPSLGTTTTDRRRRAPNALNGRAACGSRYPVAASPEQYAPRRPSSTVRVSNRATTVDDLDYDLFDSQWREWKPLLHVVLLLYFIALI